MTTVPHSLQKSQLLIITHLLDVILAVEERLQVLLAALTQMVGVVCWWRIGYRIGRGAYVKHISLAAPFL